MAKQRVLPGFPHPIVLNETATAQRVAPGGTVINVSLSSPPPPAGAVTLRQRMLAAYPFPVLVNQTQASQRLLSGMVFNDRLVAAPPTPSPSTPNRRLALLGVGGGIS